MNRMIVFGILLVSFAVSAVAFAESDRRPVPRVMYLAPDNDTVVDLTAKDSLIFMWKGQSMPAGGRAAFKFTLYKDFGYEVVHDEMVDPRVFEVTVPADKFEDGVTYSWQVKQRDAGIMKWSRAERWSFKVTKQ